MASTGSVSKFVPFLILLVWACLTFRQARIWSSDLSLWTQAVASSPNRVGPHFALAVAYQQHAQFEKARKEYRRVMELASGDERRSWRFAIAFNLAEMFALEHQPGNALILLEQLMESYPDQELPIRYFERSVLLNAHMDCDTVILRSGPHTVCASL